jgi:hypothetical protein
MNTRYSEITKSLQGRWKSSWSDAAFSQLRTAFDTSLNAVAALTDKASSLSATGKYSPTGLADEIKGIAKDSTIPVLRRAAYAVDKTKLATKNKRNTLALPKADPSDFSGAVLRAEMRTWLKSLPLAEVLGHLLNDNVDQRLLLAALEVPPAMTGLTAETRGHVVEHVLTQQHGPELARLNELDDAAEVANAAVGVALFQLRREVGFSENNASGFDAWMAAASVEIDREIALEGGSGDRTILAAASSSSGDSDFGRQIEAIFDEAFARALPGMYPDHPVNKGADFLRSSNTALAEQ